MPGAVEKVLYRIQRQVGKPLVRSPRKPESARPVSVRPAGGVVKPDTAPGRASPYSMEELTKLVHEQDFALVDLRKTVEILTEKNSKLEQLVQIKDKKLAALQSRLNI